MDLRLALFFPASGPGAVRLIGGPVGGRSAEVVVTAKADFAAVAPLAEKNPGL